MTELEPKRDPNDGGDRDDREDGGAPLEDPVVFYRARDSIQAAMLVSRLDAEGIPCRTAGGRTRAIFGEVGSDALVTELYVSRGDMLRARDVVNAWFAEQSSTDEPRPSPPWVCPACGEASDGTFDLCWNCGAERP